MNMSHPPLQAAPDAASARTSKKGVSARPRVSWTRAALLCCAFTATGVFGYPSAFANTQKSFFQNSDLTNPANYSPAGLPTAGDDVTITTSATTLTLTSGNLTVGSLNVTNNTAYTLSNGTAGGTSRILNIGTANNTSTGAALTDAIYVSGTSSLTIGPNSGGGTGIVNVTLLANSGFDVPSTAPIGLTITSPIIGQFGITKLGSGTCVLAGANSGYSGATTVNGGILRAGAVNAFGNGFSNLTLLNAAGVAAELNGFSVTVQNLSGGGPLGGNITLGTNPASVLTVNSFGGTTYAGVISGSGGLTKLQNQPLTLTGENTYTGPTIITGGTTGGTLQLGTGNNGGPTGSLATTSAITVTSPGVFSLNRNGTGAIQQGTGVSGANFGGPISGTGSVLAAGGSLTLSAANTYSGNTTINNGILTVATVGTADSGSSSNLGSTGALNLGSTTGTGVLNYTGTGENSARVINLSAGSQSVTLTQAGTGLLRFASPLTSTAGGNKTFTLQGSTAGTAEIAGAIPNPAGTTVQAQNNAAVALGANQITFGFAAPGFATVGQGISGSASIPAGTIITAVNGSTVTISNATTNTIANFTTLTITAGAIPFVNSVTKSGTGTWTLSGNNTYTGATTVNGGTLALGAANRIADVSNLTLTSGTFNTGGFSETLGVLNVTAAANLDLGNGASVLNFSGFGGGTGALSVRNYSAGDRIFVGGTRLTTAQLGQITFVNPNGTTSNATATQNVTSGEIFPTPAPAPSATGYAVVGSSLYTFNTSSPGTATPVGDAGAIGFEPEGIDFNPLTGELFAIEVGATTTTLYKLSLTDGTATPVGLGFESTIAGSYDLVGQNLGFDFNPKTVQGDGSIRIRVTASNGTDLRLNANTGARANIDGSLRERPTGQPEGPIISIVGAGYTNNIAQQGGATTLYDVSDTTDQLFIQAPPNDGTLVAVGPLSIDAKAIAGFDIFTSGSNTGNTAFLATDAVAGGPSEFFTVDLASGTAAAAGDFGTLVVSDIAIQPLDAGASAPVVRSITRSATQTVPVRGSSVEFTVTFSEDVTGVGTDDFRVTATGSTTGATVASVSGSGSVYTVTVNGFSGNGTLRLDVVDNDSITDGTTTLAGTGTGTATPTATTGAGNGNFLTGEVVTVAQPATTGAIISEFRFQGTTSDDEYVEIANTTGASLDISGWFIRTNTGAVFQDATVPAGTILPAFGHFLFTGVGYTLGDYSNFGNTGPAGAPTTGNPNPTQVVVSIGADAAPDSGVALFNAASVRQDAAGFATSAFNAANPNESLRDNGPIDGAPTTNGTTTSQHAFMRDFVNGKIKDTDNNTADFVLLATDGVAVPGTNSATTPTQLGAPNPESLSSPVNVNSQVVITLLQPEAGLNNAPNRLRTGSGNGGTLLLRRTIRNTGSQPLSRVRLLMTRITSQGSPTGIVPGTQADVRLISSGNESIALPNRDTNGVIIPAGQDGAGTTLTPVYAALLEAPSNATSTSGTPVVTGGGGGLGSSVVFDLTFPTPLLPNTSANYGFNLQVATGGTYLVAFNVLAVTN